MEEVTQGLVIFSSLLPQAQPMASGTPAPGLPEPRLAVDVDLPGRQQLAERERQINVSLAAEFRPFKADVWAEVNDIRANQHVLMLGCAPTRLERERAESVLRGSGVS